MRDTIHARLTSIGYKQNRRTNHIVYRKNNIFVEVGLSWNIFKQIYQWHYIAYHKQPKTKQRTTLSRGRSIEHLIAFLLRTSIK
jgi:hypothetical protein